MRNVLIVDGDFEYRRQLQEYLSGKGVETDATSKFVDGLDKLIRNNYDILITDAYLDGADGIKFVEMAKNLHRNIGCVILSSSSDEAYEERVMNSPVDLYLTKNKSFSLIYKYLMAMDKEKNSAKEKLLVSETNNLVLDLKSHEVRKGDEVIDLTPKEFEILKLFLLNKEKVLSRQAIISHTWDEKHQDIDKRIVDVHIKKLRSKINVFSIVSVRGYGYKWKEK